MDSLHFGVAQRRKRLYLVADFGSERAGEILFEREGVSRDFTPGFGAGEGTAGVVEGDIGTAGGTDYLTGWDLQNHRIFGTTGVSPTLNGSDGGGGRNPAGFVLVYPSIAATLTARHDGSPCIDRGATVVAVHQNQAGELRAGEVANTLSTNANASGRNAPLVATIEKSDYILRRLTPQECALLQGFPSDYCAGLETPEPTGADISFWTEVWETHRRVTGKPAKPKTASQIAKWLRQPYSDSAEYKLWGNGCSLPCVCFVMAGIREVFSASNINLTGEIRYEYPAIASE
jgi:DNA (cytosine-5)-methyltransferase 1